MVIFERCCTGLFLREKSLLSFVSSSTIKPEHHFSPLSLHFNSNKKTIIAPLWGQSMREIDRSHNSSQLSEADMRNLCLWIDEHITESIGWADLVAQTGKNHKTLLASFAKHKATTPMTWIRQQRQTLKIIRSTLPHYIHNAS